MDSKKIEDACNAPAAVARLADAPAHARRGGVRRTSPRRVRSWRSCAWASCLANLDLFIVNVALPNIGRDFKDATLEDMSWILNGYAIAYAALLVFFGRLAERYRRNLSFLLGVALFTLAPRPPVPPPTASRRWSHFAWSQAAGRR